LENTWARQRFPETYSVRAVTVAAEAEIEAGFHDVFGFIDAVDESQPVVLNESEVTVTEVVVIVLNETRDEVGECVLTADADCPSAASIVQSPDDHSVAEVILVTLPSSTALYIAQEAIPPITEASGHRRQ
jgi:hypothetical protein